MSDRFAAISNHKSEILVGLFSLGAGIGVGYFLGKRSKDPTYQVIPAKEIEEELVPKLEDAERVKNFIEERLEAQARGEVWEHEGATVVVEVEGETLVEGEARNVFAHDDEDWDLQEELAKRNTTEPYVIHFDEFYEENEDKYPQVTLTYYAGDDIMVDEDNVPIFNYGSIIGELLFGHGSRDPNVFHVRNDRRKGEYEIVRDLGKYEVEVLGLNADEDLEREISHSGVPKFRDD